MTTDTDTIVWDGWISLEVPKAWNIDEEDGVFSLYPPKGQGVLELSFFQRSAPAAPSADEVAGMAARFCGEQGWSADGAEALTLGGTPGAAVEVVEAGEPPLHCKVWHALDAARAVLAVYSAPAGDVDDEIAACDLVVSSLKWT